MEKNEAKMKTEIIEALMEVITEYNRIVPELMQELEKSQKDPAGKEALEEADQDAPIAGRKGID